MTGASDPDKPLKVYYYQPTELKAETPVWFIIHGMSRNADDYRDYFVAMAKDQGALIIAPEFSNKDWPKSRSYNLGNISISESDRTPRPEQEWSFSKIEPLFDYVVDVLEPTLEAKKYFMFGHSAGGQFVHRFLAWKPQARVKLAISANAGWYTMAQFNDASYSYDWPYSLADTPDFNANTSAIDPFPAAGLESFLGKTMVVLLGDEDTLRTDNLRQTTQADAQGQHRFERGTFFFAEGQLEAAARGVDFGWVKQIVPGVGHSGSEMAIPAAELFRRAHVNADGQGHLVIVGGGGTPDVVLEKMLGLAGGKDAKIIVLPQASSSENRGSSSVEMFASIGANNAQVLELDDLNATAKAIEDADLVWFSGGKQRLLAEALHTAKLVDIIHRRYADGAVIGGSSAGAAVMSELMIPGSPDEERLVAGNTPISRGFALVPELIIDQHFIRRSRMNRLLSAVMDHPDRIGVGIDERTAIIVSERGFTVYGDSNIVIIDARGEESKVAETGQLQTARKMRLDVLSQGDSFDFSTEEQSEGRN